VQVEIHGLNNLLDPIPQPILAYPDLGPQVIVANDDGMEVGDPVATAPAKMEEDEDAELELVSDEDGEVTFDADSDSDA
jgi:hypothetical protein